MSFNTPLKCRLKVQIYHLHWLDIMIQRRKHIDSIIYIVKVDMESLFF
jgi:hypothetical protein